MHWVAILLLAGCGRFHFLDREAPGDGPDGDAPVDQPDAPDQPIVNCVAETCNGVDDNCDGVIDELCPCTPHMGGSSAYRPDSIPTYLGNDTWAIVERHISSLPPRIVVFSPGGANGVDTTCPSASGGHPLAWNGTEIACLGPNGELILYSTAGAEVGRFATSIGPISSAALRWRAGAYDALVVVQGQSKLVYHRIAPDGSLYAGSAMRTESFAAALDIASPFGAPRATWQRGQGSIELRDGAISGGTIQSELTSVINAIAPEPLSLIGAGTNEHYASASDTLYHLVGGTITTQLPLISTTVGSVMWDGVHPYAAEVNTANGHAVLDIVRYQAGLVGATARDTLFDLTVTGGFTVSPGRIAREGAHVFGGFSVTSGGTGAYFRQRCY